MKVEFRLSGYHDEKLTEWLTHLCTNHSVAQFMDIVESHARLMPEDLFCSRQEIEGMERLCIFGHHFIQRVMQRTMIPHLEAAERAIALLKNPKVAAAVLNNYIFEDDDRKVVGNVDGILATAVIAEGEEAIYVFEAGDLYVRVKTVFNSRKGVFATTSTAIIRVDSAGNII